MTKRKIGVGVVGCGEIAQLMHLPIIKELPQLEIAALCDLSRQVVDSLGEAYGVAGRYTDHHDLINDPAVDVVVICTYDHGPIIEDVIAAGKHFTVEKPLAFTAEEAAPLIEKATAKGVLGLVGYMKLYDPGYVLGIERMASIEALKQIHVHNFAGRFDRYQSLYTQVRGSDVDPASLAAGRALADARIEASLGPDHAGYRDTYLMLLMLGSHNLAVLRGAFGVAESVEYAKAVDPNHIFALLNFANGVPCVFEVSFGAQYEWWDEWIAAYGKHDEVRVDFQNPYIRNTAATVTIREPRGNGPSEVVIPGKPDTAFRQQWLHFIDCIENGTAPRTSLQGGLEDLKLAQAIIQALPPRPKGKN